MMGTMVGEETGDDQAEGQTGARALRVESMLQILSKHRALGGKEVVFCTPPGKGIRLLMGGLAG